MLKRTLTLPLLALVGLASAAQEPSDIYCGKYPEGKGNILLRVATGGAGQSGILRALADAFIDERVPQKVYGNKPFAISWLTSDTFGSIKNLDTGAADVAITYNEVSEKIAVDHGIAKNPSYYAWRDHFILVGPKKNPAKLEINQTDVDKAFSDLFVAAEAGNNKIRFLSRYDKSATNVKESLRWASIGQTPWAEPYSAWYHQYVDFPLQALNASIEQGEYTITDFGTYLSLEPFSRTQASLNFYTKMNDSVTHPLLNPAHALVSNKTPSYLNISTDFAEWITKEHGGQAVIGEFKKNGYLLYAKAPTAAELDPGTGGDKPCPSRLTVQT